MKGKHTLEYEPSVEAQIIEQDANGFEVIDEVAERGAESATDGRASWASEAIQVSPTGDKRGFVAESGAMRSAGGVDAGGTGDREPGSEAPWQEVERVVPSGHE